ncbi:MAG: hypothetical protein OXN89_09810 [Bryobacterales bacterium]|nr:hypothetical protein [Bryobacterales bacterium]
MPVCDEVGADVCGVEVPAKVLHTLGVGMNRGDKWAEYPVPDALNRVCIGMGGVSACGRSISLRTKPGGTAICRPGSL